MIVVAPTPLCGAVTGVQLGPISATTPYLCSAGTVVNFSSIGTSPTNYTWNCTNGVKTSNQCSASYTPVVLPPLCVPWSTVWVQTSPVTVSTPWLCPTGKAVWDFSVSTTWVGSPLVYVWSCGGSQIGGSCTASHLPGSGFALSLKKYANWNDAQTAASAVTLSTGSGFDYTIIVTNNGPSPTSGTTTVTDTLPLGVVPDTTKNISAPGWSCNWVTSSASVSCQRSDIIASGVPYPTITIPAKLTATSGTVTNIAIVTTNAPTGSTVPNQDRDPAVIIVSTSVVPAACEKLVPDNAGAILAPNIPVTYTCSATGTTIVAANLEYSIKCGAWDTSLESGYTGSNVRVCRTPATTATSQSITCTIRDKTNPTVIFPEFTAGACKVEKTTSGGDTGGGTPYYVPSCVNGITSCATQIHTSLAGCGLFNPWKTCSSTPQECTAANTLSCSGPGGPPPWSPGSPDTGTCGDGVLDLSKGEECDAKNATWCGYPWQRNTSWRSIECKLIINTNPWDNPFTEMWMTIPQLSSNRIGWYSQLNGGRKMPFKDNKLVIGVGTSPFSIADTVVFGMKTLEPLPVIVEADKKICLISKGDGLNNRTDVCTTFGEHAAWLTTFSNGAKNYVVIGNGYYHFRDATTNTYKDRFLTGNRDYITLFEWPKEYPTGGDRFYRAFQGLSAGIGGPDSILSLEHYSSTTGEPIDLVGLPVRISGAMVGATSATVNRKLESYINSSSLVNAFLSGFTAITTTTTNTTSVGTTTATNMINVNTTVSGNTTVSTLAQMEALTVNGNKNILSLKNGNLTVECPSGSTALTLDGVRTVLVESGNLILNCNNGYGSSDTSASWAWIVKGGNILVATGVTNIAGVYVALGVSGVTSTAPCGETGNICPRDSAVTSNILRINGSLYGNADPLFKSRLYIRGTSAYDILTTGVILSYSNRALVSPPPLLSQFLNNYSVTRVVK